MNRMLLPLIVAALLPACADHRHRLVVSVAQQRMALFDEGKFVTAFPVSTSKFCLSNTPGSYGTPLGRHEVAKKIGDGQPPGMKFSSRQPTGEIVAPNSPGRDPIVTRIFWLKGLEPWNSNSFDRDIYIHGTAEEYKLGQPASYGCVRMASQHVLWLYGQVGTGARVDILPGPLPPPDQLPP
jgi:lipoprotein-anchoring transpeptidase ErfK/SrfK